MQLILKVIYRKILLNFYIFSYAPVCIVIIYKNLILYFVYPTSLYG